MQLLRTDSSEPDFLKLVELLNAELAERDGEDHAFYNQFNSLEQIRNVVLCYDGSQVVGCGAMKSTDPGEMEVKRMYVNPSLRGKGIAGKILKELEQWALDLGNDRIVLETGKRQPEAIRLYERSGYARIPNYGPYQGVENSVCFKKNLST